MNKLITLLSTLLLVTAAARAATLPASEDTSSSRGNLTIATNKAATLPVDGTRHAFVYFDLSELPTGTQLRYARLRLYLPKVVRAGAGLTLHKITGQWDEAFASIEPAINPTPLATLLPVSLGTKRFVSVDVTATVQGWLATPSSNQGFALAVVPAASAKLTASVLIGAKEGSGSGYPAELEVEIADDAIAPGGVGTAEIADGNVTSAKLAAGVDAAKLATGIVSNAEFDFLNGVTSDIQGQIDGKLAKAGGTMTGTLTLPADGLAVGNGQITMSSGQIGIGVAAAESPLHVAPTAGGRGIVLGVSAANGGFTSLSIDLSATSGGHARIQTIKAAGSAYGDIVLSGDGGNVGVGGVPTAKLDVNGDIAIRGALRVPGAGIGTNGAAFIHVTAAGNAARMIDNPVCNGDPNAILIITHRSAGDINTPSNLHNHPVGVSFSGSNWYIYNEDFAIMPAGLRFNILVIKP